MTMHNKPEKLTVGMALSYQQQKIAAEQGFGAVLFWGGSGSWEHNFVNIFGIVNNASKITR